MLSTLCEVDLNKIGINDDSLSIRPMGNRLSARRKSAFPAIKAAEAPKVPQGKRYSIGGAIGFIKKTDLSIQLIRTKLRNLACEAT